MGEKAEVYYKNLSFSKALQMDKMMASTKAGKARYFEIAKDLSTKINAGKLLEIGFGSGRVLEQIHRLNGNIELYGIDISEAQVELARKKLEGIPVNLYKGSIEKIEFDDNYFDIVTCTGTLYLINKPVNALDEIYRVLKPHCSAYIFDTHKDYDKVKFKEALKNNFKRAPLISKLIGPYFIKFQLKKTFTTEEVREIIKKSKFSNSFEIEEILLSNLPTWLRIKLNKI